MLKKAKLITTIKKIILGAYILSLTACFHMPENTKPLNWVFEQMPQDAPENFKQGWRDGCETGLAGMTNAYYRAFYHFKQDPVLRKDPIYYKTWKDTYTFCRHYAYGRIREGDQRMRLPNKPAQFFETFMGAENFLDHGALNMRGPGNAGLVLEQWGQTAGTGFFEQGGVMDFSDDMIFNGNYGFGSGGTWDFTPQHSIVPY